MGLMLQVRAALHSQGGHAAHAVQQLMRVACCCLFEAAGPAAARSTSQAASSLHCPYVAYEATSTDASLTIEWNPLSH